MSQTRWTKSGVILVLKTRVSEGGRIVIPKEIRDRFGIEEKEEIRIEIEGKRIVLIPEGIEDDPVGKLYGSVRGEPEDNPKEAARKWARDQAEREAS
jgi:AbrB family looped-hinge helix DNA binding protein